MSTFIPVNRKCTVCGKNHRFRALMSTTVFGPPDLDNRPDMLKRATLGLEIQMCDSCFYANYDISKRPNGMKEITLKSEEYLAVVNNEAISQTAKAFWLSSIIHSQSGDYKIAGFLALKAAWVFDDYCNSAYAKLLRETAIKHFEKDIAPEYHSDVNCAAILTDMKRRVGDFDGAIAIAEHLINHGVEASLEQIMKFQIKLCKSEDTRCHREPDVKKNKG